MRIQALGIEGCFVVEHDVFPDERGFFREWFKASTIEKMGIDFDIAQANFSVSAPGVIRGLHYSLSPEGQSKLVTCVQGGIFDHLVDIRVGSPTFLEKISIELDSNSGLSVFIATGVAHGFSVPKETSAICYLTSSEFSSVHEKGINPNDRELAIDWAIPLGVREIISQTDASSITLSEAMRASALPSFSKLGG